MSTYAPSSGDRMSATRPRTVYAESAVRFLEREGTAPAVQAHALAALAAAVLDAADAIRDVADAITAPKENR